MEQISENIASTELPSTWIKPTCEIISVSLECTAYAGAQDLEE